MILLITPQRFTPKPHPLDPVWAVDPFPRPDGLPHPGPEHTWSWSISSALAHGPWSPDSDEQRRWDRLIGPDAAVYGAVGGLALFPPSHKDLWEAKVARRYLDSLFGYLDSLPLSAPPPTRPKRPLLIFFGRRWEGMIPPASDRYVFPSLSRGNRLWNDPENEVRYGDILRPVVQAFLDLGAITHDPSEQATQVRAGRAGVHPEPKA